MALVPTDFREEISRARDAAMSTLRAVSRGRRLDLAFEESVGDLPNRERRWVQEACFGTVRLRGRLDHLLDLHLRDGLSSLSPVLLDLLRLGAYQILYMEGVPSYAAVSQTVDQVKKVAGGGGARMANGVLRSLEREGGDASRFPTLHADPEGYLSTWGSHPAWMVRRWLQRWGPEDVLRLVEWNNLQPPLFFRPVGVGLEEARTLLGAQGWNSVEAGPGLPCLKLEHGIIPAKLLEVVPGFFQDPGAALVSLYADIPAGSVVGDLCAAPGGKALAMAAGGAYVLAADRSLPRLRLLKRNLARVGGRVELVVALAQAPPFRELPHVLLDVPCSGTGTFRRHPDARWRLTLDTLSQLVGLQGEMMDSGSRLVPVGGVLVYSTCTLEPEENHQQVEAFLSRNPGFHLAETGRVSSDYIHESGCLSVLPQRAGFDGAFAARLVRVS